MNSASYEYRNMSARRGAQFVPIGMPTICWKTFVPDDGCEFLVRNGRVKGRKIKGLDVCDMVEIWRLKML